MTRTCTPSFAFAASCLASAQPVSSELKMKVWKQIDSFAPSIILERSANELTPSKSIETLLPARLRDWVSRSSWASNAALRTPALGTAAALGAVTASWVPVGRVGLAAHPLLAGGVCGVVVGASLL